MKRLSQKTWDLIHKLHGDQSFWGKLIRPQNLPLSLFNEIASADEALAIPQLTEFLLNKQPEVRNAAARTIGRLIANLNPQDFAQLDEACRNSFYSHQSRISHMKPSEVKQLLHLPNAVSMVGVASFHGSGFIRAAAINELANDFDGSELPFLLVRLNDWVEVVRESAATAVLQRIRPDYAKHFFRNLPLVFRLRSCGRSEHGKIIDAITALLQSPDAVSILREGIQSNDRWLRRESFRLAMVVESEQNTALLKEVLSDADPVMRLWAARNLLVRLGDAELLPVLARLGQDRFVPIRCEALNILMQRFPNEGPASLNTALLDGSASVRATARFWIKKQKPEFNFAEIYKERLNEPAVRSLRAAILGVGETGIVADVQAILPFLDAPLVSIQKAAIHVLAILDGDRHISHFITALTSEDPGISNEATRALASRTSAILDQLHLLFKGQAPLHVRVNLFKLMMNLNFWDRGAFLFEALRDRDAKIVDLGRIALGSWLCKSRNIGTPPRKSDVVQLGNALKASAGMLSAHEVQEFEFLLRTYK